MKLTEEQKAIVVEKLEVVLKAASQCPCCQWDKWVLSDTVFELREFFGGGLLVGGSLYPILPMSCAKCGYARFFNALHLGIVEQQTEQADSEMERDEVKVGD